MMIINLAISDFMMIVTQFPIVFKSVLYQPWMIGKQGCQSAAFCGALFGILSISTLTAVALDRYYVICSGFDIIRKVSYTRSVVMAAIVWSYSLFWASLPLVGIGKYVPEGYGVSCTFEYLDISRRNRLYVGFLYIGAFILPVSTVTFCYIRVVHKVKSSRKSLVGNDTRNANFIKRKTETKVAKLGFLLTACFIISWTPYATVAFIGEYVNQEVINLRPLIQTIPVIFAKSSAAWNPFFYAIAHKRFRSALKARFVPCSPCVTSLHLNRTEYFSRFSTKYRSSVGISSKHDYGSNDVENGLELHHKSVMDCAPETESSCERNITLVTMTQLDEPCQIEGEEELPVSAAV